MKKSKNHIFAFRALKIPGWNYSALPFKAGQCAEKISPGALGKAAGAKIPGGGAGHQGISVQGGGTEKHKSLCSLNKTCGFAQSSFCSAGECKRNL
ncbi:MAG: hypothetical protein IDH49_09730 [Gammaproteobacteria bacterium]|nr:hypothetical protein [Gammaproteobacteria bacterium]